MEIAKPFSSTVGITKPRGSANETVDTLLLSLLHSGRLQSIVQGIFDAAQGRSATNTVN